MFGKKEDEIKITTLIGEGARLNGDFAASGSARIDGNIGGDVEVEGTLILGVSGRINGNVKADAVIIGGEVLGNIAAPKKTELTNTAKVMGDIQTAVIVIDEHAVFQGKCSMEQSEPDDKAQALAEKAANASKKSAQAAIDEAMKEVQPLLQTAEVTVAGGTVGTMESGQSVEAAAAETTATEETTI